MIQYLFCFNQIKLALLKKKQSCHILKNKKNTIIIDLCIKYNVALGYKLVLQNSKVFYLVYLNPNTCFYNLKNLLKITKPYPIKLKTLQKLNNKNTYTVYILNTSKGFLSIKEAMRHKIGGVLTFRIF